ncbi:MAG: umuDC operon-like protein [Gammaproteobacteria bacterium]|uniref:LexA family protein n=1 Tax=Rhodoferax sp. TaxID=50421 RepID=UPI0018132B2B|nr:S24 family peptidase [Rhodoferax sp.]MBU3897313.1 umuDC operon-like protein [Gammaproteobacteria bacterium]MBA3058842.1 umuDC operon-like protein [Rhodoferax sp.]MBU3998281.1 umuDC operon-like protein [Gammaproteobacteria bacterium]MBU4018658.1 umuDC operon-like protein [Gammaproteobacteria bacterium]MBU4079614.1 umuDC operon-like protein [Gammaproteobacteria bacterium]
MARTNNDESHLKLLRDQFAVNQCIPSYAGISRLVGFKTKNAAVLLIRRLSDAGYFKIVDGGKVVPLRRFFELPLINMSIRAGEPDSIDPQTWTQDTFTLEGFLFGKPSNSVVIRVKGDSMCDAGIFDGDFAVVERSQTAYGGQFVIANVNGEFTLKELKYENQRPVLMAHNSKYPPIHPKTDLTIFGIVQGIVRNYVAMQPTSTTGA